MCVHVCVLCDYFPCFSQQAGSSLLIQNIIFLLLSFKPASVQVSWHLGAPPSCRCRAAEGPGLPLTLPSPVSPGTAPRPRHRHPGRQAVPWRLRGLWRQGPAPPRPDPAGFRGPPGAAAGRRGLLCSRVLLPRWAFLTRLPRGRALFFSSSFPFLPPDLPRSCLPVLPPAPYSAQHPAQLPRCTQALTRLPPGRQVARPCKAAPEADEQTLISASTAPKGQGARPPLCGGSRPPRPPGLPLTPPPSACGDPFGFVSPGLGQVPGGICRTHGDGASQAVGRTRGKA